ncbi:MAG: trypsin-like peptidase domain-containing protein [Burkholderiales bacterium]
MVDSLLLTAARVSTFDGDRHLTNASGFFFARDGRLFLVTSRHVVRDAPSGHAPDRLEIELHVDAGNLAQSTGFPVPLYRDGAAVWRQGEDGGGAVDVATIPIAPSALPASALYRAFTPDHLPAPDAHVEVGSALSVVGFPLGFHDTLHHMPVVRHAVLASAFGLRFQGEGYFLTDARTHRGTSGAPVVLRDPAPVAAHGALPWTLLGVHSTRIDVGSRDQAQDEALGLNGAWYADILLALTRD